MTRLFLPVIFFVCFYYLSAQNIGNEARFIYHALCITGWLLLLTGVVEILDSVKKQVK